MKDDICVFRDRFIQVTNSKIAIRIKVMMVTMRIASFGSCGNIAVQPFPLLPFPSTMSLWTCTGRGKTEEEEEEKEEK